MKVRVAIGVTEDGEWVVHGWPATDRWPGAVEEFVQNGRRSAVCDAIDESLLDGDCNPRNWKIAIRDIEIPDDAFLEVEPETT